MAIQTQIQGASGTADVGGTAFGALKIQQMPVDYGSLGNYRKSMLSGTMDAGLTSGSDIYQFRWTDSTRLCLVQKIILDGMSGSATAFAAGFASIRLNVVRSFTASGSGGTAATLTGSNGKTRTSMGTTLVGDVRIASTAALGTGTRTIDPDSIGQVVFSIGTTASVQYVSQFNLMGEDSGPTPPLVLAQNEGFVIQAAVPATGTWQFGVTVVWTEVTSY